MLENKVNLKVAYDKEADAVYIYLSDIEPGSITETVTHDEMPENIKGDINLNFDKQGILRGIEILYATEVLPQKFLAALKD